VPENARTNSDGFRVYEWPGGTSDLHVKYGATERMNVISVTAARNVIGIPYQIQQWQVNNLVNLATGQRRAEWRDYSKSKRGRLVKGYRKDSAFPGEFVTRMLATEGDEDKLTREREWLKVTADDPRDIAAVRGSVVHKLIEMRVPMKSLSEDVIRWYIDQQWDREDRKVPPTTTDDDVSFVGNCLANYWNMREEVPFVIIAQEPQVWNLRAGYAGSADALIWFLPPSANVDEWQEKANRKIVTAAMMGEVGGRSTLGDWKTSPDVYTGHVIQGTAYLAADFVGRNGDIDERLTEILKGTMHGAIIKIRPDGWEIDEFAYRQDVSEAFFGEIATARFLFTHKKPTELFTKTMNGQAELEWRPQ
jgi:hypothetical protein